MSLKFVHQIIIFAGISVSLIFAWFSFTDPGMQGLIGDVAGGGSLLAALGLVGYEIHFLRKTRKLVIG
jgi:hypothetical protein